MSETGGGSRAIVHLVETWYHQMWNRWDKSVFDEILAPDVEVRGSLGRVTRGFEGLSSYLDEVRTAFPDFRNRIDEVVAEEDKAFARLTYTGTHEGPLFGVPPTRASISYAGAALFYCDRGRIHRVWVLGDVHGLLEQLRRARSRPDQEP